jgi:hypothetical protein
LGRLVEGAGVGRSDREPVDLRRLVAGFLRMAPDVAIVGEVRDRKALPELPAHVATVVQLATTLANGLSSTLRDAHEPLFGHGRGPFGFQSCALQVERIAATALALSRVSPPGPSQCHVKRILPSYGASGRVRRGGGGGLGVRGGAGRRGASSVMRTGRAEVLKGMNVSISLA